MPAAAVIPAPVAYIKVVAVKKLVVGFLAWCARPAAAKAARAGARLPFTGLGTRSGSFTLKKLECLKQAYASEYISME